MRPEVDFQRADVEQISKLFLENGCVMLRNFCPPATLSELRGRLDALHDEIKGVHLNPKDLEAHGMAQPQEYIFRQKHHALLDRVFGPSPYRDLRGNVTRRMLGGGQGPLPAHLDAFFHPMGFTVNFWVPLQPCGVSVPSLGVVHAGFDEVLDFTGYQPTAFWQDEDAPATDHYTNFRPAMKRLYVEADEAAAAELRAHFADRLWTPVFELGDAMMLSNWTFHFTHATPQMDGSGRLNIEMRFHTQAELQEVLANLGHAVSQPRETAAPPRHAAGFMSASAQAAIAYRLLRHIADIERRRLDQQERRDGEAPASRAWILETYAECLDAVRNHRSRLPQEVLRHPEPQRSG